MPQLMPGNCFLGRVSALGGFLRAQNTGGARGVFLKETLNKLLSSLRCAWSLCLVLGQSLEENQRGSATV